MRVLIVDDDAQVRQLLVDLAKAANFDPIEAKDGQEALEVLRTYDPIKAIITDYQMPIMNGAQLIRAVRQNYPEIFVVLSSGSDVPNISADMIRPKPQGFGMFVALKEQLHQ